MLIRDREDTKKTQNAQIERWQIFKNAIWGKKFTDRIQDRCIDL